MSRVSLPAFARLALIAAPLAAPSLAHADVTRSCAPARAVAARGNHSCAALATGKVSCWGWTDVLGLDSTASPVAVNGISSAVDVATGADFACALTAYGAVRCWGAGSGTNPMGVPYGGAPETVSFPGSSPIVAIAAGREHACAVNLSGEAYCWGSNWEGKLGAGLTPTELWKTDTPVKVVAPSAWDSGVDHAAALSNVIAIAAGDEHTCAATRGGSVWCWGSDGEGQLDHATAQDDWPGAAAGIWGFSPIPIPVTGVASTTALAAGQTTTCARKADATVRCWGNHWGNFVPIDKATTVFADALQVGLGGYHGCAATANGGLVCVGSGTKGQIGQFESSTTPVPVSGVAHVAQVATGFEHTCVRTWKGEVLCFGSNDQGQLGDGTWGGKRATPAPIAGTCR